MRYWRFASTLALATLAFAAFASEASADGRHGRGHPGYGPSVGFYGSAFWPGWGFYAPFGPYWSWWAYPVPYVVPTAERVGLRLEVEPPETEVYVDGYLAGTADEFDGLFQRLHVTPGEHVIELYLDGHQSAREDLYASPGTSYKIRHEMLPLAAGEAAPVRPRPREPEKASSVSAAPEAQPPAGAPAPPPGFGVLAIRVQPGPSEVRIDGEAWPAAVDGELTVHLPAGPHTIEIRGPDHQAFSTEVEVVAGRSTPLNVRLSSSE
jgi:hypothetical protein